MSGGAALAGPYVNVETNGLVGLEMTTPGTTDIHVAYEGEVGAASTTSKQASMLLPLTAKRLTLSSPAKQVWVSPFRMH